MSHLQEGDAVQQGEVIGHIGSTGKSTADHLHFGIKVDGQWIDPEPYLDRDYQPVKMLDFQLPVLKRGMKGDTVRALQALLVGYGYNIVVDGRFGAKTENALMCFQEDNGLEADGSCGRKTWTVLLGLEGG